MISSAEDLAIWRDRTEGEVVLPFLPAWVSLRSLSNGDLAIGSEADGIVYEVKVSRDVSEDEIADMLQVDRRTDSAVFGSACAPSVLRQE